MNLTVFPETQGTAMSACVVKKFVTPSNRKPKASAQSTDLRLASSKTGKKEYKPEKADEVPKLEGRSKYSGLPRIPLQTIKPNLTNKQTKRTHNCRSGHSSISQKKQIACLPTVRKKADREAMPGFDCSQVVISSFILYIQYLSLVHQARF